MDDLRERMALNRCTLEAERSSCYHEVDDILEEIKDAGYVLMPRERAERFLQVADFWYHFREGDHGLPPLLPEDLEPLS
jgi:hypothetical protein